MCWYLLALCVCSITRYDAGDNVKFNLPMAWSAGVLAWSLVDFEAGFKAAGQYKAALDSVKWATDYFIKCIGDGQSDIVVQVRPQGGGCGCAQYGGEILTLFKGILQVK